MVDSCKPPRHLPLEAQSSRNSLKQTPNILLTFLLRRREAVSKPFCFWTSGLRGGRCGCTQRRTFLAVCSCGFAAAPLVELTLLGAPASIWEDILLAYDIVGSFVRCQLELAVALNQSVPCSRCDRKSSETISRPVSAEWSGGALSPMPRNRPGAPGPELWAALDPQTPSRNVTYPLLTEERRKKSRTCWPEVCLSVCAFIVVSGMVRITEERRCCKSFCYIFPKAYTGAVLKLFGLWLFIFFHLFCF